ncbi:ThiF family adenylyltransferase [Streptomyces sp. ACA25]|uniref:ThiF family adenylyltransferase n=1 Tax=Streptomyces sp. ACA25 TaxID=3022596 RepID=UPI002306FDC3|nr:ThiF family adenylyltransferase [Streptomyces sp. ACA25]MDB1086843.1 ThiF family adenylyltransferase [Streptomyces sp. ACA25]
MIKPSLRRGWRDRQTVRYGVTPAHSVLFGPLDSATESFLSLLDGTRGLPALRDAAAALGLGRGAADRLARQLAQVGVLDDATADRSGAAQVTEALRPDLASLSLLHPDPGAGLRTLLARRHAWVQIRGAGRVGAATAVTLAQAGVGRVEVVDGGEVAPGDVSPGGVRAEQAGRRRDAAARAAVHAAVPWSRAPRADRQEGARLVVVAPRDGLAAYAPDPAAVRPVLESGTPHLYAGVVEGTGFAGPLVLPGVTGCAECLLRGRTQREPGWPLLVGQWRNARRGGVPACDAALAALVAGFTASLALSHLDGTPGSPPGIRTEVVLPELSVSRIPVDPHPECACGAAGAGTSGVSPAGPAPGGGQQGRSRTAVTA